MLLKTAALSASCLMTRPECARFGMLCCSVESRRCASRKAGLMFCWGQLCRGTAVIADLSLPRLLD